MNCDVQGNFDVASTLDQILYVCSTSGGVILSQKQSDGTFVFVLFVHSSTNSEPTISPDGTIASVSLPSVLVRLITQPGQTNDNILSCPVV